MAKTAEQKEEFRLTKDVFPTMVAIPETVQTLLRGWKPPNEMAYILFQTKVYEIGAEEWRDSTFTLNVDGRPEQLEKLNYYCLVKGYKIIHYGNFPKANHPNPRIAAKARMHTGSDNINPWDQLESACKQFMGIEANRTARENELLKRLEEAEKRAASTTAPKREAKNEPRTVL